MGRYIIFVRAYIKYFYRDIEEIVNIDFLCRRKLMVGSKREVISFIVLYLYYFELCE